MVKKKSFIFGLGAGLIISSFAVYVAYSFDYKNDVSRIIIPKTEITDDEIVSEAKKLGMIFVSELPEESKTEPTLETIPQIVEEPVKTEDAKISEQILISIPQGSSSLDIADLLQKNSVIDDKYAFNRYLKEKDATKLLRFGDFYFNKNMAYDEVADLLVK